MLILETWVWSVLIQRWHYNICEQKRLISAPVVRLTKVLIHVVCLSVTIPKLFLSTEIDSPSTQAIVKQGILTFALLIISFTKGLADCSNESKISVRGETFSRQPSNFEIKMRLCVLRCCINFTDDILMFCWVSQKIKICGRFEVGLSHVAHGKGEQSN